jgi:hypothetical protein
MQEATFQYRRHDQVLPVLFRRYYHTSANHEDLQGVNDPRGPVGMTATRKRALRCSQPPLGA